MVDRYKEVRKEIEEIEKKHPEYKWIYESLKPTHSETKVN